MTTTLDPTIRQADITRLRASLDAVIAVPGDVHYDDEVSTWNSSVTLRPAVVIGARTPEDVVTAVAWAVDLGLPVGVNATGHGAVANAAGALLINTSRLSAVSIDVATATATVGAGARIRDVAVAAARYGWACVQGSTSSTGAVGFTLGGGLGVLSRTFGLAADHVLSIDVVTPDGRLRTVDADHTPDLFWALRGGKGNFGVVTSYRTALITRSTCYGGGIFFDGVDAPAVLHHYRHWITGHTDDTSSSVALLRVPADPGLPEPIRGRFVVHVRMGHVGDPAEGARIATAMRRAAPVLLDTLGEIPLAALDMVHLDPPGPVPAHERGCLLDGLPDDAIDAILRQTTPADSPLVLTEIRHLGGAVARPPVAPNAVPGRSSPFALFAIAPAAPPLAEAGPRAVQTLLDAMQPWRSTTNLPNFLGRSTDPTTVAAAWPPETRARLLDIKRAWDPDNLFRLGHALLRTPPRTGTRSATAPPSHD
ncbi:MAG TPA: FAD-binding protein [Pseudonocardia sp.]